MLRLTGKDTTGGKFSTMVDNIASSLGEIDSLGEDLAGSVMNFESIGDSEKLTLNTALDDLDGIIGTAFKDLGFENMDTAEYARRAGAAASAVLMAQNPNDSKDIEIVPGQENKTTRIVGGTEGLAVRQLAKECYSSANTDVMVTHSCAFTVGATGPSAFLQAVAPLIMINPGDTGLRCIMQLMFIYDRITRDTSGKLAKYNRRNLTQAAIDPSILEGNTNAIIPIYRDTSVDMFVSKDQIATKEVMIGGKAHKTSWLKTDTSMDLIDLSQTDDLVAQGLMDESDQLDTTISVEGILLGVGAYDEATGLYAKTVPVSLKGYARASFSGSRMGEETGMDLQFGSQTISFNKNSKNSSGDPVHQKIVDNDLTIICDVKLSGSVDIRSGEFAVYGNLFRVKQIFDAAKKEIALTDDTVKDVVEYINGKSASCNIIGVKPDAYRTDRNHRYQGDNMGSARYVEEMYIPLRPPLTCDHYTGDEHSSEEIDSLIGLLHTRMNHDVVKMLDETATILQDNELNGIPGIVPDVLGFGRLILTPKFIKRELDLAAEVMGLNSASRSDDVKATLVNAVRDVATRLYWASGYEAANDRLNNGAGPKPTVVIATNARIAEHLYESGDERLLGDNFNFKVVTSPSKNMKGKIYIMFSVFDENRHTKPNPLSFAATGMAPEVVYNLTLPKGGKVVDSLGVYPRYKTFNTSPVLGLITIPDGAITKAFGAICNSPAGCP